MVMPNLWRPIYSRVQKKVGSQKGIFPQDPECTHSTKLIDGITRFLYATPHSISRFPHSTLQPMKGTNPFYFLAQTKQRNGTRLFL